MSSCISCENVFKDPVVDLGMSATMGGVTAAVAALYSATGVLADVTVSQGLLFGATFGAVFLVTYEALSLFSITGDRSKDELIYIAISAIFAAIASSLIMDAVAGTFTLLTGAAIAGTSVPIVCAIGLAIIVCSN